MLTNGLLSSFHLNGRLVDVVTTLVSTTTSRSSKTRASTRLTWSRVAPDAVRHAFTSLFQFGVFETFPELRIVVLESGASWIGYWLDRMDGYCASLLGGTVPLREKPSTYFRRQCWISCDPDERTIPALVGLYGAERFFWASDFPHPDHTGDYIAELNELVSLLPVEARSKLLGENVLQVYGVS